MIGTNLSKLQVLISLTFLLPFLLKCQGQLPKSDDHTLAIVGTNIISVEDFSRRLEDIKRRTGVNDSGELRRNILNNYISEELLIHEARRRGFDKDSDGIYELERIEIQELLNAYHQKYINTRINVSERELYELYLRLNTKLKARHLYAPTYHQADSLYQELQHSKTFQELAKNIFSDPVLKNSGGLLGYFTVDEMEPAFEDAAYQLKVGEISKPVKTSDGYSIIRVEDRVVKPILTEYEYAKHRSKLQDFLERRKMKKASQNHVDSLKRALHVSFEKQTVRDLFLVIQESKQQTNSGESRLFLNNFDNLKDRILLRSDLGSWTVEMFQNYAKFTSPKQHQWIRTEENLKEFIAGLVVRSYFISTARQNDLHRTQIYQKQVMKSFDEYLLDRVNRNLYEEIVVPEDSLKQYFYEYPQRFAVPAKVNLREIVLDDQQHAAKIADQLKKGKSFSDLARQYSIRRWSAENGGELGFLSAADLGRWSDLAFSLKIGEWAGPVKMESYLVFLQCIEKKSLEARSFELARNDVEETLRTMYWETYRTSKLEEIRKQVNITSHPEKLMKIVIN